MSIPLRPGDPGIPASPAETVVMMDNVVVSRAGSGADLEVAITKTRFLRITKPGFHWLPFFSSFLSGLGALHMSPFRFLQAI